MLHTGGSFPRRNYAGDKSSERPFSSGTIFRGILSGGNYLWVNFPGAIIHGGNFLRGTIIQGQLSGGQFSRHPFFSTKEVFEHLIMKKDPFINQIIRKWPPKGEIVRYKPFWGFLWCGSSPQLFLSKFWVIKVLMWSIYHYHGYTCVYRQAREW